MKEVSFSDEQLVQLYTLGNKNAMTILFNRHYQKVMMFLYFRLKDKKLAEDILQDSFINVVDYIDNGIYTNNGKFFNLLIRIARNKSIDYIRKQKIRPTIVKDDVLKYIASPPNFNLNEIEMQHEKILNEVIQLVDLLPKKEREILILRHYADLSFKEIAELLDININTALGRMRTALQRLREFAEERGIDKKRAKY